MKFYEIDFLETGETGSGDAISLRYRDDNEEDYVHVVDGGYTKDGEKLVEHIREYYDGTGYIDHVVLTHPDGDHAAGLKTILEEFTVGTLWMNRPWNHIDQLLPLFNYDYTETGLRQRLRKDFPYTAELEDIAEKAGIEIKDAFQGVQIGEFTVLAPTLGRYIELIVSSEKTPEPQRKALIEGGMFEKVAAFVKKLVFQWGEENLKGETEGTSSENETSIIQMAELCGHKILLTGDAGVEALEEAYNYAVSLGYQLPGIDKFHVPHHGSRRNLSSDILDKWLGSKLTIKADSPSFTTVISANQKDNEHPKLAVVRALHHRGAQVIQTNGVTRTSKNAPDRGWTSATPLEYPDEMEE